MYKKQYFVKGKNSSKFRDFHPVQEPPVKSQGRIYESKRLKYTSMGRFIHSYYFMIMTLLIKPVEGVKEIELSVGKGDVKAFGKVPFEHPQFRNSSFYVSFPDFLGNKTQRRVTDMVDSLHQPYAKTDAKKVKEVGF
jgi:hypothetical protein